MNDPSTDRATDDDFDWDGLLEVIDYGQVVPVLGPELLLVRDGDEEILLGHWLARRLAERFNLVPPPPTAQSPTDDVVGRYLATGGDVGRIYPALNKLGPRLNELPPPGPLLKLAEILPFKLFVTTTFDSMAARALEQARGLGSAGVAQLSYSDRGQRSWEDLPTSINKLSKPTVYHLFGRLSNIADYAVTQEDTLEYFRALQSSDGQPANLFDALHNGHLLILGSRFHDWLARFFLRMGRKHRLSREATPIYLADETLQNEPSFALFLRQFSPKTAVFRGGRSTAFIDDLHGRWKRAQPGRNAGTQASPVTGVAIDGPERDSIFLSYAREDRETAERIAADLRQDGIDVWFDGRELELGEPWERRIRKALERCSHFMPLISAHTATPERRYFRMEWTLSEREAGKSRLDLAFILPVAIDGTRESAPHIPNVFRTSQWERLLDGKTTPRFRNRMKTLVREYRRARVGLR